MLESTSRSRPMLAIEHLHLLLVADLVSSGHVLEGLLVVGLQLFPFGAAFFGELAEDNVLFGAGVLQLLAAGVD